MFGIGKLLSERRFNREAQAYPSFGGRVLRQRTTGHSLLIAASLFLATAGVGVVLTMPVGEAAAEPALERSIVQPATAPADEVRTTDKTDRLKRPSGMKLEIGCDGVWGNEPLECLAQTV